MKRKIFVVPPSDEFYDPQAGSFGRIKRRSVDWHGCRETFEDVSRSKRFLFYAAQKPEVKKIKRFIALVEDRLKLKKKDRLNIKSTSEKNVILIEMSDFWRKQLAKSLLTILLRAGRYHHRDRDFKRTLVYEDYLQQTVDAVELFLAGHTKLSRSCFFRGWRDTFYQVSKEQLKKMLEKPKKAARK